MAIREESGLSRAAHLKRMMGAFFLALVLILTGACGGAEKKEDEKKDEEKKKGDLFLLFLERGERRWRPGPRPPPSSSRAPVLYGRLPEILAVDFGRKPG